MVGILVAFGHSVLAMSGLETLAQVYREIEHPKLPNLKKTVHHLCLQSCFHIPGLVLRRHDYP